MKRYAIPALIAAAIVGVFRAISRWLERQDGWE